MEEIEMKIETRRTTRRRSTDVEAPHQRSVLRATALIGLLAGIVYAILNITRGSTMIAVFEALYALLALTVLLTNAKMANTRLVTGLLILPMLFLIYVGIKTPTSTSTIFVWVFLVPPICYITMGVRAGFVFVALFYGLVSAHFYQLAILDPTFLEDRAGIVNVVVVAVSIWTATHIYESSRVRSYARLENQASRDPLTGLYNRRRMSEIFEEELDYTQREDQTLGLIMIDLDHFKQINDTYGHEAGDEVLLSVSQTLERNLRATDFAFRMGGEEFCILVADINLHNIDSIGNILRKKIASLEIKSGEHTLRVTASLGGTIISPTVTTLDGLLQRADELLYRAKNDGRNRMVTA